jgi:predicted DsbA family dithiol-disulfide isomerase
MPTTADNTITRTAVEVFADVTCPFAHVGLRRFVARRKSVGLTRPILLVRAWPLELVNGEPLERDLVAQHVAELREQVAPDLFHGFDPSVLPLSSLPALELVAAAYEISDAVGERVSLEVRDALFERGLDVGDRDVLGRIATDEGITVDHSAAEPIVRHDYEEGRRRGVRGSPEFFLDGRGWYCPSLHIEQIDGTLRIEPDLEAVDAFLTACFR